MSNRVIFDTDQPSTSQHPNRKQIKSLSGFIIKHSSGTIKTVRAANIFLITTLLLIIISYLAFGKSSRNIPVEKILLQPEETLGY